MVLASVLSFKSQYLQMCFQREESAQYHQVVLSRLQPVAQETQFHLALNSPPQLTGQDPQVPRLSAQVERLHYLQKTIRECMGYTDMEEVNTVTVDI